MINDAKKIADDIVKACEDLWNAKTEEEKQEIINRDRSMIMESYKRWHDRGKRDCESFWD